MKLKFSLLWVHGVFLCCIILVLFIGVASGSAISSDQPLKIAPQFVTCQPPCSCMPESDAIQHWGAGGYSQCDPSPCGQTSNTVQKTQQAQLNLFCYRQKNQEVVVITTTPVPVQEQPVQQVIPVKIPAQQVIPAQPKGPAPVSARKNNLVPPQVAPVNPPDNPSSPPDSGQNSTQESSELSFMDVLFARISGFLTLFAKPEFIGCQDPCECMSAPVADLKWGVDGYTQCSDQKCGEDGPSEFRIPKFCLRSIHSDEQGMQNPPGFVAEIPTTTLIPANVKDTCIFTGKKQCSGVCKDINSDPQNCGSCGISCLSDQMCIDGKCVCPGGTSKQCGLKCVDVAIDSENCGKCGSKCYSMETCCFGKCTNLQRSSQNCNHCGYRCQDNERCQSGTCVCGFSAPTKCGSQCIDTSTDNLNCGGCGIVCQGGHTCCYGNCVDTNTDSLNCGSCGSLCIGQAGLCQNGICGLRGLDKPCSEVANLGPSDPPCKPQLGCQDNICRCCPSDKTPINGYCVDLPNQVHYEGRWVDGKIRLGGSIPVNALNGLATSGNHYFWIMQKQIYRVPHTPPDLCGGNGCDTFVWYSCAIGVTERVLTLGLFGDVSSCDPAPNENSDRQVGIPGVLYNDGYNHLGAGKFYKGLLYVPVSKEGSTSTAILAYDEDLILRKWGWINQGGDAWVSINPVDQMLYTSGGVNSEGKNDYKLIYRYDPGNMQTFDDKTATFQQAHLIRNGIIKLKFTHPDGSPIYGYWDTIWTQGGDFSDTGIFYYVLDSTVIANDQWTGVHAFRFPTDLCDAKNADNTREAVEITLNGDENGILHVAYDPCYLNQHDLNNGKCALGKSSGRGYELEGVAVERIDPSTYQQRIYLTANNWGIIDDDATVYVWTVTEPVPASEQGAGNDLITEGVPPDPQCHAVGVGRNRHWTC